ncbi:hypothetical protein B0G71_6407 [Paraburkholderia sp. BL27I4N3]|uniref:hypothetical protein n=1 Tax=Paraburkholderia sp. BL27I4N3 TaxID=1938805 RepID=UPI000E27D841|nr:hypothetical protein [Paraburkholderia sp. BL27I4N3]REE23168.1 hypothetical protein B0G71_6407 [Paraburkholderia sp. BL27I4N3]
MFEDTIRLPVLTDAHAAVLRCYLAVSDVAAYKLQGRWLSSENMVESSRLWLARNACVATWLERVTIAAEAHAIAAASVVGCQTDIQKANVSHLFTEQFTVNFASPVVARIWQKCVGIDFA